MFLQCGGIGNIKYAVNQKTLDKINLKWAVIADSDKENSTSSPDKNTVDAKSSAPDSCQYFHILDRSYIENYLDGEAVSEVTGISLIISKYGRIIQKKNKSQITKSQKRTICEQMESICKKMSAEGLIKNSLIQNEPDGETSELIMIFNKLQSYFSS